MCVLVYGCLSKLAKTAFQLDIHCLLKELVVDFFTLICALKIEKRQKPLTDFYCHCLFCK